ncbi:MAG TPA: SDR family oxidoreductase [Dokdonella sp.]
MDDEKHKVALVIGGSRGIGGAITRRLAADGVRVCFTYRSRAEDAEALVRSLARTSEIVALPLDAGRLTAADEAVAAVTARFGRLDILVVNAGTAIGGPLGDYVLEAFDDVFSLNVRSPFLAARAAARVMRDDGRIVIIGSIMAARTPADGATLYAASKAALVGMVRGLARDLGARGITANLVQPGPTETERNPSDGPDAAELHGHLAIRRHATPDEVAALVGYLTSDAAAYVTGSVYNIDGGFSA